MEDRRNQERFPASYDVYLECRGKTTYARSRDISMQGIGIYLTEPLEPGDSVNLDISIHKVKVNMALPGKVVYCIPNPDRPESPYPLLASIEFLEEAGKELVPMPDRGKITRHHVSHTVSIDAPADKCYRLMCDFDLYPKWAGMLDRHFIKEKYPNGRGRIVEFQADLFFRKVAYILEYFYDDEGFTLSWESVGGDVVSTTGKYSFKPIGEERAMSTYELDVAIDFYLPKRMIRYFSQIAMRKTMKEFKDLAEKS